MKFADLFSHKWSKLRGDIPIFEHRKSAKDILMNSLVFISNLFCNNKLFHMKL